MEFINSVIDKVHIDNFYTIILMKTDQLQPKVGTTSSLSNYLNHNNLKYKLNVYKRR